MKFSERIGISPIKTIQIDDMDIELRNGLWNIFKLNILDLLHNYSNKWGFERFCQILCMDFYKNNLNNIPIKDYQKALKISSDFNNFKWFEVYDFLEFVANINPEEIYFSFQILQNFRIECNKILEREKSGYRFVNGIIAPITNSTEIQGIENAINASGNFTALNGANIHLKNSLAKISDKISPDYRNSIKESISAVESVAKTISANNNDTLGGAIDKIQGKIKIHKALVQGFKNIYGYTSDTDGIRHAIMESPNCDFEDAIFMLVSCSAFVNYLIAKATKHGISFEE